jgi:hypothetical protein
LRRSASRPRCDERPEEKDQGEAGERAHQPVGPEDAQVAARADHGEPEGILRAAAEHEAQGERGERDADLLEHVPDHAEAEHEPDVEHRVLDRIGADRARHHDHRGDGREGHAQHRGEDRHRGEHHDEAHHVA